MHHRLVLPLFTLLATLLAAPRALADDAPQFTHVSFYRLESFPRKKRVFGHVMRLDPGLKTVGVHAAMHFKSAAKLKSDTTFELTYAFYDKNGRHLSQHDSSHTLKKGWVSGYCSSQERKFGPGSYLVRIFKDRRRVGEGAFHVVQRPAALEPMRLSPQSFRNFSLKLWESSKQKAAAKTNDYRTVFDPDATRFVSAALSLTTTKPLKARVAFKLSSHRGAPLYRPPMLDNSDILQTEFARAGGYIASHRFSSREGNIAARGHPGTWKPGVYWVEAIVAGRKVLEQPFVVAHPIGALVDQRAAAERMAAQAHRLFRKNSPADRKKGLELINRAIANVDDQPRFYAMRARALFQDRKLRDAAADLERAIRLQPRDKGLRIALAEVQMEQGPPVGYFRATRTLTEAITLDPKDARLRAMRR
ncbi:MAG: tetratricopeptide repeat protein, partial [Planctomycetota bacterium]